MAAADTEYYFLWSAGRPVAAGKILPLKISTKYCPKPPEKSIPPTEVSGNIWSIFGCAIFGRSRHLKYRQNITSNFATRWALMYQKYLESKQQQDVGKKKKKRKRNEMKKRKRRNQREIMTNYFLLQ
jgi:hypothetical protein